MNANQGLMWQGHKSAIRSHTVLCYRGLAAASYLQEIQPWSWRLEGVRRRPDPTNWRGVNSRLFCSPSVRPSVRPSLGVSGPFATSLAGTSDTFRPFLSLTITPLHHFLHASELGPVPFGARKFISEGDAAAPQMSFRSFVGCKELLRHWTGSGAPTC